MGMVYVREHPEQLTVYMLRCGGEALREIRDLGTDVVQRSNARITEQLTCFRGENTFVIEHILHPCHNIVYVGWRGQFDLSAILINPSIIEV